jgi:hypothetical protein
MGIDPGYSWGLVVRDGDQPLYASVLRCEPPANLDDHAHVAARLARFLDCICDVYDQWAPADGMAVACEAFNTPQRWKDAAKGRRKLSKVEVEQHLWPRMQFVAVCGRFHPVVAVKPRSHANVPVPAELATLAAFRARGWVCQDPEDSLRDAQSAWRVAMAARSVRYRGVAA